MSVILANQHREVLDNISLLAINDTLTLINGAKDLPFVDFRDAVIDGVPAISSQYGAVAALTSAEYYDLSRLEAERITGTKYATYQAADNLYDAAALNATLTSNVNYGLRKMYYGDLAFEAAVSVITGGVSKNVFDHSRENIVGNTTQDIAFQLYRRVPKSDACAWCKFKAVIIEGGESASTISDEGFHNNCKCVVGVSFQNELETKFRQAFFGNYEQDFKQAKELIQSGELQEKVVQKGTAEYEAILKKDITAASREFRINSQRYKSLSPAEKTKFRVNLENKSAQIANKINNNIPLSDLDKKILQGWNYEVPKSVSKPLTTNAKDVLSVMRKEFGYR